MIRNVMLYIIFIYQYIDTHLFYEAMKRLVLEALETLKASSI